MGRGGVLAHEFEMRFRRAFVVVVAGRVFDEAVTGGGLHKSHADFRTNPAQPNDVFRLQIIVFEDDFQNGPAAHGGFMNRPDLVADEVPLPAEDFPGVRHHVDF